MGAFEYTALDTQGRERKGLIEGDTAKHVRQLLREIATLLCYEVTRDLSLAPIQIETPMMPMQAQVLAGKKLVFAPILRAGIGLIEGMLDLVPSARVAHIGLYRSNTTSRRRPICPNAS